jgi:hypothetical protein
MSLTTAGSARRGNRPRADVAVLVTALVVLAAYPLLRYGGRWGDGDSASFAGFIGNMFDAGRLMPSAGSVYPNGYAYQALGVFGLLAGGVSLSQFQLYLSFFLTPWIVLPAWMLYRELTGSARGATLATAILLVQPEFLFPLMRGTHEKFTRGLILLALYLFVKSIGHRHPLPRLASTILAFYLVIYGVIAFNNLLAFSLIAALLLALGLLAALRRWSGAQGVAGPAAERRLRYAVITATLIAFLFTFFFYQPAKQDILVMQNMVDRVATLLLNVERSTPANPYAYTAGAWVSGPAYLALTLANWILLIASAAIWLWQSLFLLRHRGHAWQADRLLLWALYGAFAIQGALSILVDRSGALAANLQLRAFPSFVMLAVPLAARAIVDWQASGKRSKAPAWAALLAALGIMAALSVLKATNEPLVSNKWAFYIPAEMRALDRADVMLADRSLWTEFDERLLTARTLRDPSEQPSVQLDAYDRDSSTRDVLVSDVIRARGVRLSATPPMEADSLLTYDNGQAQLYHLRPRTPYQR